MTGAGPEASGPMKSFHGQSDRPRNLAPALDLAADERREGLAALQVGLGALLGPDALHDRIGERGLDGSMQRVEDRSRRRLRREQAIPGADGEVGDAGLREGRYVGQHGLAL